MENKSLIEKETIGCCGFFCGSCPDYRKGTCVGCRLAHKEGDCFTHDCVTKRNLSFCGECPEFPCEELEKRERATVLDRDWLAWKKREKEKRE